MQSPVIALTLLCLSMVSMMSMCLAFAVMHTQELDLIRIETLVCMNPKTLTAAAFHQCRGVVPRRLRGLRSPTLNLIHLPALVAVFLK